MKRLKQVYSSEENRKANEEEVKEENQKLLRMVHKSNGNASLAVLLRFCVVSTPTRFGSGVRLISDFYARKTSRLEWLTRDRVTQSLVYQISRLADELRILKEIVRVQRDNVSKVLSRVTDGITGSVGTAGTSVPRQSECTETTANPFQKKALAQHERFLADIERLEDTIERLKRQAALFTNIKTEGQNAAIFAVTSVTVIFLPLSFVTGYMGMNTKGIRDVNKGQWLFWAVSAPLSITVVLLLWLVINWGEKWRNCRQARKVRDSEDWKWGHQD